MDPRSFSSLSHSLASRLTRRTALSGIGGCGLAVGLLGTVGARGVRAALGSGGADSAPYASAPDAAPAWRLSGDVMEACRCAVTCPCNFTSDPTELPCGAIVGWRIEDGQYGETRLNDLNLIAILQIPGNAFGGGWTLGYYLDERATAPQADALGAIFSGQAGGWPAVLSPLIANPLPAKQAPIHFELVDGEVKVNVPGLLEVGTEHVPHPMPGMPPLELQISNLAVPFYTGPAEVRRSTILKLSDPNLSFEYMGRSSLIGRFVYEGP